jgi:hypothetical protein
MNKKGSAPDFDACLASGKQQLSTTIGTFNSACVATSLSAHDMRHVQRITDLLHDASALLNYHFDHSHKISSTEVVMRTTADKSHNDTP